MYFYYPYSSMLAIFKYRSMRTLRAALTYWHQRIRYSGGYKALQNLRESAKGRNAFVFANGPSVSILDPLKVKGTGFDIFAVNGYLWSDFSKIATPTHYVLSDPACFYEYNTEPLSARHLEISKQYIPLIKTLDTLGATLFVPMQYVGRQKNSRVIGFCDIENELSGNVLDIARPRGYISMTAYKALSIARYMKYDRIYICGFDSDYFKRLESNEKNEVFWTDEHFFGEKKKHPIKGEGDHVGEYLYLHHFLFSHLRKFSDSGVINLDKTSLNTFFSKEHGLDIYK